MATRILECNHRPGPGSCSCLGLIGLTGDYPAERVEAAARRALSVNSCTYQSVKSILKNNLDGQPAVPAADPVT